MKRKRIMVIWMRMMGSQSRILSVSPALLYFFLGVLILSWVVLAIGGHYGRRLYSDYAELKEENYYLRKEERQLEQLRQIMVRIQTREDTLGDYLGLDTRQEKKTIKTDALKGGTQKSDQRIERR